MYPSQHAGEIIELLLRYGADPNLKDKDGLTCIDCCGSNDATLPPQYERIYHSGARGRKFPTDHNIITYLVMNLKLINFNH
jgi:ankyrin repeat protein